MAKRRSLKGHVADCSTGFLRFLNVIVGLGAVALIALTFVIRPLPTGYGWGLIVIGGLALLSGLIGACTAHQLGCFGFHLLFLLLSSAGLCSMAIVTFVNTNRVVEILSPTVQGPNPYTLAQATGITCAVLFCLQMLILIFGALVNACGCTDYYEDLEAEGPSAKELARQQREDEKRRAKVESTSAHKLAETMKAKYGQWQPAK